MAISLTYTDESAVSDIFNAIDSRSEIKIDGTFTGTVRLQHSRPGAGVWDNLKAVNRPFSGVFESPDSTIDYRISVTNIVGTVNIYVGP